MGIPAIAGSLPTGWLFIQLPGHRSAPEHLTYERFSFEELPPIREPLDGSFDWLRRQPRRYDHSIAYYDIPEALQQEDERYYDFLEDSPARLLAFVEARGYRLPAPLVDFITNPELNRRVRSCTGCHFDIAVRPAELVGAAQGLLIKLLVDSQGSPCWYLLLDPAGDHAMVQGRQHFGDDAHSVDTWARDNPVEQVELTRTELWLCARSFEEYIHRFWMENEIWYGLNSGASLTTEQQAYLDHYHSRG